MNLISIKADKSKIFALIQLILVYGFIFNPWTSFPYTFIIIIISVFLITYWADKSLSEIGFKSNISFYKTIGVGLLLFAVLIPVIDFFVQPLVNKLTGEVTDYSAFKSIANNFPKYSKYLIYILISAGFGEEILFRGFLFRQFKIILPEFKYKIPLIIILSAILFSLPHLYQGLSGLIITFIFGLIFAITYVKFNYNIWITIILHGLIDTMFITLAYFDKLDYYTYGNDLFFGY